MAQQFNPYLNPQYNKDRLRRQRDEIDYLLNNMDRQIQQPQTPVNNIINTQQPINNSMYIMKVLNDNDEAENIFVEDNTIFIGTDKMQIKKLDGSIEKYSIKKYYPNLYTALNNSEQTKALLDTMGRWVGYAGYGSCSYGNCGCNGTLA